jgi:hypothetical protein
MYFHKKGVDAKHLSPSIRDRLTPLRESNEAENGEPQLQNK